MNGQFTAISFYGVPLENNAARTLIARDAAGKSMGWNALCQEGREYSVMSTKTSRGAFLYVTESMQTVAEDDAEPVKPQPPHYFRWDDIFTEVAKEFAIKLPQPKFWLYRSTQIL